MLGNSTHRLPVGDELRMEMGTGPGRASRGPRAAFSVATWPLGGVTEADDEYCQLRRGRTAPSTPTRQPAVNLRSFARRRVVYLGGCFPLRGDLHS